MTRHRLSSCCLVLLLCLFANGAAQAGGRTHVYLMRGIFDLSVGLDALAGKFTRMGIAASVYGHADEGSVAAEAIRDYKSGRVQTVILIGHSLGAGAVVAVAHELNEAHVPVALLIALDPVFSLTVSPNVRRAVNFYVAGSGQPVDKEPGFRGTLTNLDVSGEPGMDHMAVQSADKMHARMIGFVRGALGGGANAAAAGNKAGQGTAAKPGGA